MISDFYKHKIKLHDDSDAEGNNFNCILEKLFSTNNQYHMSKLILKVKISTTTSANLIE